jgi:hypothetical protein
MNNLLAEDIKTQFFGNTGNVSKLAETQGVANLVTLIVNTSLVIAGAGMLFFLIAGGIAMVAGAGQDDPQKLEQGKKTATSALIGFIVVFASYWIVQLIGEIIGFRNIL